MFLEIFFMPYLFVKKRADYVNKPNITSSSSGADFAPSSPVVFGA